MTRYFSGKSRYYAQFRRPYPAAVFEDIIKFCNLDLESRILDLGCGTGNIAIPLAMKGFQIYAVDPEPEMLEEGKKCQCRVPLSGSIQWVLGSDATLDQIDLPTFRLCTMGLSFHWMNREEVLKSLDTLIEPGGGIACIGRDDNFQVSQGKEWDCSIHGVLKEMLGDAWHYSRLPAQQRKGVRHEKILSESPFPVMSEYKYHVSETVTIDDIFGQILSHSYVHPVLLRERKDEFKKRLTDALLEYEPSGRFVHNSVVELLIAKRE